MKSMCVCVLLLFSSINLLADHNCNDSTNPNETSETCDISFGSGYYYVLKDGQAFSQPLSTLTEAYDFLTKIINSYHLCNKANLGKLSIEFVGGYYYVQRNENNISVNLSTLEEAIKVKDEIQKVFSD